MWKAALVGALALATVGASSVRAQDTQTSNQTSGIEQATKSLITITRNDINRFKASLKLTALQEQYWPAVDAELRQLAAEQTSDPEAAGLLTRLRNRVAGIAVTAMAVKRIGYAALPLIKSLDDGQKDVALKFVNRMGMGHLAAAF